MPVSYLPLFECALKECYRQVLNYWDDQAPERLPLIATADNERGWGWEIVQVVIASPPFLEDADIRRNRLNTQQFARLREFLRPTAEAICLDIAHRKLNQFTDLELPGPFITPRAYRIANEHFRFAMRFMVVPPAYVMRADRQPPDTWEFAVAGRRA